MQRWIQQIQSSVPQNGGRIENSWHQLQGAFWPENILRGPWKTIKGITLHENILGWPAAYIFSRSFTDCFCSSQWGTIWWSVSWSVCIHLQIHLCPTTFTNNPPHLFHDTVTASGTYSQRMTHLALSWPNLANFCLEDIQSS